MTWDADAIFYHLFPLGCLGAPARNSFDGPSANRLDALMNWIPHIDELGANAVLLGPVFESSAHGYDTADFFRIDRRLGEDAALAAFSRELHRRGIRLVFDAVFHHTGRDFWALRDVREHGRESRYGDWYHLDFTRRSPYGEPFHYKGWAGHYDLAKLNLQNPDVSDHLFAAVTSWVERFDIDGLRLDAADSLDHGFQHQLAAHCRAFRNDFWLMGEVVHGDYRKWAHEGGLTCTTNYQAYKGLWSSLNDRNYFEIAYALKRQFGADGIYRDLMLYNFADNHDVERVASILKEPAHLYPLYILLLTMPGVPSLYYGSEYGVRGRKGEGTDAPLRPALDPVNLRHHAPESNLYPTIRKLVALRHNHRALRHGDYEQLLVAHEQFAFMRRDDAETIIVALNAAPESKELSLRLPNGSRGQLIDLLNDAESLEMNGGSIMMTLPPRWGRILRFVG